MSLTVPAKYKILASLAPALLLLSIISTTFFLRNQRERSRLAREKKGAALALPHVEQAREIVERVERYLRLPGPEELRRDEIRDFVQLALDSLDLALEFAPKSEEASRLQGRALELQYNFDEARDAYARAIEAHPESPARFHLGLLGTRVYARARLAEFKLATLTKDQLSAQASEPLRRFQAIDPVFKFASDRKRVSLCTVCVAYAVDDHGGIPTLARAAREWDATEWLPSYLEGLSHWERKRPEEALKAFEDAVRLAPAVADPHAWLGVALHALGRRTDAIAALSEALRASEHFLEAYYVRGMLLFDDGRFADASADFAACARLRPSLMEVQHRLGVASFEHWQRSGRSDPAVLETAAAALGAAVDADPRDPKRRLLRARAWVAQRKLQEAEKDLAELAALAPDALDARLLRAEILEGQGRGAEADAEYAAVLEKADAPRQASTLRLRAASRARAGRWDDALADLDALLSRDPNDAGARLEKARILLSAKRLDEALKAVDLAAPTARAALLRAEILLEKGETAAARAEADTAVKGDPELAEAYVLRGRAALAAGDKAAAAEDFKRAVEKRPDLKAAVDPLLEKASTP